MRANWTSLRIVAVGCLLVVATVRTGAADSTYQYKAGRPDGIGKFYFNREIARVMGYEAAGWLERPAREQEERPDLLLKELHLKAGMTVADIGAGSGYLSKRMAEQVSPGKVLAVDVQPQMVRMLQALSREAGTQNVVPIQASADDPHLPNDSVDLAILVDVYHELEFPQEVIGHVYTSLKVGGELVLVEYRGEDARVPIKTLHKMTVMQVRREMEQFPLIFERSDERLPLQHMIFFRKQ